MRPNLPLPVLPLLDVAAPFPCARRMLFV